MSIYKMKGNVMAKIRVDGESVMNKSRSLCYDEYKINEAIELLVNILQNDEMNDDEIRYLAMDILDGKFEIYNTKDGYDIRPIIPKDESLFNININIDSNKISIPEIQKQILEPSY